MISVESGFTTADSTKANAAVPVESDAIAES